MKTNSNSDCFGITSKAIFFILFLSAGLFASMANAQTLTTDQPDYTPGDTVFLTGCGFQPLEAVTMRVVHVNGAPDTAASHLPWNIVADGSGCISSIWIVDLDAVGALLRATADGQSSLSHAEALFTDNQAGDLSQGANGRLSPIVSLDPIDWENGNLNPSKSHYTEGYSIPYQLVLTGLQNPGPGPGGSHYVDIEWDIKHSGAHAIDFITTVPQDTAMSAVIRYTQPPNNRLNELLTHYPSFGHFGEGTDLTLDNAGNLLFGMPLPPTLIPVSTFPIPAPTVSMQTNLPAAGNFQPTTRYNSINSNPAEEVMTLLNGTIVSMTYINNAQGNLGDLNAAQSATRMRIVFTTTNVTVVFGWGGHIGSRLDWGEGNSAGGISGSPYHTRFIELDGSGGNQDRSLSAEYIAPPTPLCTDFTFSGSTPVCPNSTNSYSNTVVSGCTNATHSWSITSNTSGAAFNGSSVVNPVSVNAGTSCGSFELCDTITCDEGIVVCCHTITVEDNIPPVITNCTQGSDLGCNPTVPTCANVTAPSATDACSTPSVTCSAGSIISTSTCGRSRTITWTATDACGNTATCQRTWTWTEDTTAPTFTNCTPGTDLGCNPVVPTCTSNNVTAPTATDACGTPSVTCSAGSIISTSTCGRSRTITWTATDACGNSSTCQRTFTWTEDTTPPAFTNCTPGSDLGCNPTVPTCANQTAPTATDACVSTLVTCSAGSIISTSTCGRSRTITWTATDGCGNTSTCQRTWTWTEDTTPPAFTNCTAGSDLGCNPIVPTCANVTAPTATDACGTPSVTCSAGSIIQTSTCGRSRTITWTATDVCLNTSTCQRTWTWIEDTTPPAFTNCTPGIDLGCNPTIPTCANQTAPTATDACGTPSVTCSAGSVISTSTCGRSRTITWTATDVCSNTSFCIKTWTWTEDTTAPAFTNCTAGSNLGCNPVVPTCANVTAPTATDACSTPSVTCSAGSIISTSTCGRSRTITWTATDGCANTSTCQRTWTWTEDTTPPAFTNCTPGSDLGCNPTVPTCANVTAPSATDACGTPSVTCSAGSIISTSTCGRSRTITWTATDVCSNTSTCSKTWTWTEDTDAPVFDCPADATVLCGDPIVFGTATATDVCTQNPSVVITISDDVTVNPDGSEIHCRTWEATDDCGNVSICTQCITTMCVGDLYCGFTQGFWGNAGGLDCNGDDKVTILTALLSTQLVVGCNPNTFTVGVGDYQCVLDRLPGGGPAAQIFGTNTCASIVGIALHSGDPARFRNVLLAQTITTMLNVRYDVNLGNLAIGGIYLTTIASDGCDTSAAPTGSPSVYTIPQTIIDYLGSNNTVNDLIALANDALCGVYTPSVGTPTLGDITKALDAFNQGFDECRFLISFSNTLRADATVESMNSGFAMIAYPNPFNSMTSIDFTSGKAYSNVKVEVFSITSELVATLFNGPVSAGGSYRVNFDGAKNASGVYTYKISTDSEAYFDKLILIK